MAATGQSGMIPDWGSQQVSKRGVLSWTMAGYAIYTSPIDLTWLSVPCERCSARPNQTFALDNTHGEIWYIFTLLLCCVLLMAGAFIPWDIFFSFERILALKAEKQQGCVLFVGSLDRSRDNAPYHMYHMIHPSWIVQQISFSQVK